MMCNHPERSHAVTAAGIRQTCGASFPENDGYYTALTQILKQANGEYCTVLQDPQFHSTNISLSFGKVMFGSPAAVLFRLSM